ncbi:hypothetical protein ACJX0J_028383, partial [Zea mays]
MTTHILQKAFDSMKILFAWGLTVQDSCNILQTTLVSCGRVEKIGLDLPVQSQVTPQFRVSSCELLVVRIVFKMGTLVFTPIHLTHKQIVASSKLKMYTLFIYSHLHHEALNMTTASS